MEFEYRYLGRTGIRVSPLCLGTMMFGGKTSPEDSYAIINRAIDEGINFIDTANVYVNGRSEEVTGEALKRNGHRDWIVLATKCHGNMHKVPSKGDDVDETQKLRARLNPNRWGNSRRQIIEQCDASLKRLQTDWIDLYQIHRPHPDCAIDETLRAMDDLVRAGKVRYIGCSTFAAWQVVESLWAADRHQLNRFVTEQPPYHLLDRRIERELIPVAQTYGLGLIPWSPLAGGFLTGKYKRGVDAPADTRYGSGHGRSDSLLGVDRAFDVVEVLEQLAKAKGCTVSQLGLAWCMHQPGVTSPVAGPRTMEQLEDNLGALSVEVTDADRQKLDEVSPPGSVIVPFYEAQFGPSVHRF
ncbi:aldo/keto reductase [Phycisphaerales bacterium AB-hyl4]|uniref:Aldo/keto reductase n=1 Tax=Natronomicrosphaera hydrolytica TaxID=3242702 RepID=A0ABV4U334_9BACT